MADQTLPPSLGDEEVVEYRTIIEKHDMPGGGRRGLLAFLDRQLNIGGIQKFVVELGKPILVKRKLKADQVGPTEFAEDDLFEATMNAEMEEFPIPVGVRSAYSYLFRAFNLISEKQLKPMAIIVPQMSQARQWVGTFRREIFGTEVLSHKEMPDQTALLVATTIDDPLVPVFSLRMEMTK